MDGAKLSVLPGTAALDLAPALGDEMDLLEGSGERIGIRDALMGFSWSVRVIPTTTEGIFDAPGPSEPRLFGASRRVVDGAPILQISPEEAAVHCEYTDDYGAPGPDRPGLQPGERPVDHWISARNLLRAAGFIVRKETFGPTARMIGADGGGSCVSPNQRKTWLAGAVVAIIGVDLDADGGSTVIVFDASHSGGA